MITEEMFQDWLESPVTEYLHKYLKDSIKEESELVADAIVSGGIISENEQIRTGTLCETLERIKDISLDEIQEFYHKDEE